MSTLIGKEAEIIRSSNKSLLGIKGKIINETKNTLTIMADHKEKTAIKSQIMLKINNKILQPAIKRPDEVR